MEAGKYRLIVDVCLSDCRLMSAGAGFCIQDYLILFIDVT